MRSLKGGEILHLSSHLLVQLGHLLT